MNGSSAANRHPTRFVDWTDLPGRLVRDALHAQRAVRDEDVGLTGLQRILVSPVLQDL